MSRRVAALLAENGRSVKVVAGSQSLGPMLNMRLVQPDLLVDITGIDELRQVKEETDGVVIGACVTHSDIEDGRVPDVTGGALPSVARGIAYRAVRNRGTIGGSLTHADPSADWISILCRRSARQSTLRGPQGVRTIPVEDYMLGALEADLRPGELLVSVKAPRLSRSARWGYYKICRKTGEFAHAIGAFVVDPDRGVCRAVIGATESRPIVVADARAHHRRRRSGSLRWPSRRRRWRAPAGMNDPLDRQTHVVALRRAVERATGR